VELVFCPFDMETVEVRYQDKSHGKALPHHITRHVHPKARAETPEPPIPPATGIDYLELTAHTHHLQVRADRRIGYNALFSNADQDTDGDGDDDGCAVVVAAEQLSLTDLDDLTHRKVESV